MSSESALDVIEIPGFSQVSVTARYESAALRPTFLLEASVPIVAALALQRGEDLVFSRMDYGDAAKHLGIEVDVVRYDPARVREAFQLVEHVRGSAQVRLAVAQPTESLVQLFVRSRRLREDLKTGTWITWAETVDPPTVKVSLVVVATGDVTVSHGRWQAQVEASTLPPDLAWLATGKRSGWVRSGVPQQDVEDPGDPGEPAA